MAGKSVGSLNVQMTADASQTFDTFDKLTKRSKQVAADVEKATSVRPGGHGPGGGWNGGPGGGWNGGGHGPGGGWNGGGHGPGGGWNGGGHGPGGGWNGGGHGPGGGWNGGGHGPGGGHGAGLLGRLGLGELGGEGGGLLGRLGLGELGGLAGGEGGLGGMAGLGGMGMIAGGIGALGAGLASAIHLAVELAKRAYPIVVEYNKAAIAIKGLTGSDTMTKHIMDQAKGFSHESVFDTKQITDYAKKLLGIGVTADQVMPTIKAISDVASGVGADVGDLINVYAKVMSNGNLTLEEMNRALAHQGLGAKTFAEALNLPADKFMEMVKDGKVGSDMFTQAFANMTSAGGKFHDMTKKIADTDPLEHWEKHLNDIKTTLGKMVLDKFDVNDRLAGAASWLGRQSVKLKSGVITDSRDSADTAMRQGWLEFKKMTIGQFDSGLYSSLDKEINKLQAGRERRSAEYEARVHGAHSAIGELKPVKIAVVPDEVKEFIKEFEKLKPFKLGDFSQAGFGDFSMFGRRIAMAQTALQGIDPKKGSDLGFDQLSHVLGNEFLNLEKRFAPQNNGPALIEAGTQAAEALVSKYVEGAENQMTAQERVQGVLEAMKRAEEENVRITRQIFDVLNRQDVKALKIGP